MTSAAAAIGIDVGGTQIRAALISAAGNVLHSGISETPNFFYMFTGRNAKADRHGEITDRADPPDQDFRVAGERIARPGNPGP